MACGTGKTSITAAKRRKDAKVTGIDFTPQMLTQAKAEAALAEVEDIQWIEGDVEDLPFEDNSFAWCCLSLAICFRHSLKLPHEKCCG